MGGSKEGIMGFKEKGIHSHSNGRMQRRQHLSDCCFLDFVLRPNLHDFSNAPFGPEKSYRASAQNTASATQCLINAVCPASCASDAHSYTVNGTFDRQARKCFMWESLPGVSIANSRIKHLSYIFICTIFLLTLLRPVGVYAADGTHLRDKNLLYEQYDAESVVTMYLTVSRGNAADGTDHTWEEINTYSAYDYTDWGVPRYKVNGLLQAGDETGPLPGMLGYGRTTPNATVQIRGQTSSRYSQKNYKIRLRDNQGSWRDFQTIALNKHQADGLRFRNKLGFDLLTEIPQIMSLRTQFVHLYVKDLTGSDPLTAEFEDYGLYTQVEQLNKRALRAHGLDRDGYLYKINEMEFYRYEDVIVPIDDPRYDEAAFEVLLECKGRTDHSKLIKMLEAVNDFTLPTDELLDTYFDTENIAYWMAFMILTGNTDTQNRNFYIYSSLNGDKWYILPWDNDALLSGTENFIRDYIDSGSWESGVSNYWGNMLFRRCLQSTAFLSELDAAINDLRSNYLTEEHIGELMAAYSSVVKPYVYRLPDRDNARLTEDEYDFVVKSTGSEIEANYEAYRESLEKPLPFYVGTPEIEGENLNFIWDISYDFDAEDIRYDVYLARDYLFEDIVWSEKGLRINSASCSLPEPGQYFLRVTAVNASGFSQDSFDFYVTEDNGKAFGAVCFYILPDGTLTVEEITE